MTTDDLGSRRTWGRRSVGTTTRLAALGITAVLALAGCSTQDGYVDLVFDNGDPLYSPLKESLFDESGVALCETPTAFRDLETRAKSFSSVGGVVIGWLFEVDNTEPDPETAEDDKQRAQFERQQDSLPVMYQLTHPLFDERYDIATPEDLAPLKQEWQEHLATLGDDAPLDQYVRLTEQWLETPEERYNLRRVSDVEGFIEENEIPTSFNGIRNNYLVATVSGGDEYLMITNKETGDTELLNANGSITISEDAELFIQYEIDLDVNVPNLPEALLTLSNDQCPSIDGANVARFWVHDFELLDGTEPEPVELV